MESNQHLDIAVKIVVDSWHGQHGRIDKLLELLSDEDLSRHTAPGRNTGTYIFGHLIAVNDRLIEMMGWGNRLHPELDAPFLMHPEGSEHPRPTLAALRNYWTEINTIINNGMAAMQTADWFTAHNAVSAEDFAKEPHRNKLNVILGRTVHSGMHLGQLNYLVKK